MSSFIKIGESYYNFSRMEEIMVSTPCIVAIAGDQEYVLLQVSESREECQYVLDGIMEAFSKGHDADTKYIEELRNKFAENSRIKTTSELFTELTEVQKDELFRMLQYDRVYEDVIFLLEDNENQESIAEDVVNAYVYDGEYDPDLSYWDNLTNLVKAKQR